MQMRIMQLFFEIRLCSILFCSLLVVHQLCLLASAKRLKVNLNNTYTVAGSHRLRLHFCCRRPPRLHVLPTCLCFWFRQKLNAPGCSLTTGSDLVFFYDVILDDWSTMPKQSNTREGLGFHKFACRTYK